MDKLIGRSGGKRRNSIVKLKLMAEKLQKSLLLGRKSEHDQSASDNDEFQEVSSDLTYMPAADVKEGHFAVFAMDHVEPKRFLVPINFLTHPTFMRLLEQAAEEYGFDHDGALTIPCRPSELEGILAERWQEEREYSGVGFIWDSCKTMALKSCEKIRNNLMIIS